MNLALPVGSPLKADSARDRVGDWRGAGVCPGHRTPDSGCAVWQARQLWIHEVPGRFTDANAGHAGSQPPAHQAPSTSRESSD